MRTARIAASTAPAAFAALCAALATVGAVPVVDAVWAAFGATLAFVPTGWSVPGGVARRAAEAALLPAALALAMIADLTLRRLAVPPLLVAAGLAAFAAAARRCDPRTLPWLAAGLALAVRAATGLGLVGLPWWHVTAVLAVVGLCAWSGARLATTRGAAIVALAAGTVPLERLPLAALVAILVVAAVFVRVSARSLGERVARGWLPGAVAAALVAATLAPWGGLSPARAFPGAGWLAGAALVAALALTPRLRPALAGAAWLGVAVLLGPVRPAPPGHWRADLTAAAPEVALPASSAGLYLCDLSLSHAAALPQGTVVARATGIHDRPLELRAGIEAAEWSHERADVRGAVGHAMPADPVWRPDAVGRDASWGIAGRVAGVLPAGVAPRLVRDPGLPPEVVVGVAAAGTARPAPPRDWALPAWIAAGAGAVALLQLLSGTWREPAGWLPWVPLAALAAGGRVAVEPLRTLAEQHGVDLVFLAFLAAWLPLARRGFAAGRVFVPAAALLLPLAAATPRLTPPMFGDEPYHLAMLASLARGGSIADALAAATPPGLPTLHGPALAVLLLPSYLLLGRTGALLLLATAGALLVALVARRAAALGVPARRRAVLAGLLLTTLPLAVFSTQIWVEVVGALAAAAALLLAARRSEGVRGLTALAGLTLVAVAVKARLALVTAPIAAVAAWRGRRRTLAALLLAGACGAGLAVGWLALGHPFGPFRRLPDLLPRDARQPLTVLGGLAFDPAGGLAFAAPLLLVALAGLPLLWRRGGAGERALVVGGALTVLALLHSTEWYGGGSPPARYLVPLLPLFTLAGGLLLARPPRWLPAAVALLPLAGWWWWTLLTRPPLSINPGNGSSWLAAALARRLQADPTPLLPSFLRPGPATVAIPAVVLVVVVALIVAAASRPAVARTLGRQATTAALLAATALITAVALRHDRVVELEGAQVRRLGGRIEPPPGTWSVYRRPSGWRVGDGEGVEAPLNLAAGAAVRLEGWLDGAARSGAAIEASWDGAAPVAVAVAGSARGSVPLPAPPGAGRHRLRLVLRATGGEAVLDRLVVER